MMFSDTSARRSSAVATIASAEGERAVGRWFARDGAVFPLVLTALAVVFLPLQNRYWVPGGDSEAYLSTARSLVLGQGFRFNGQPVSMFPPGWPVVLAGVLHFTTAFLALKLVTMSCMAGALAVGYWICRRFCSAGASAGIVVLCAITTYIFQLTIWLHSDAMFALLTAVQLLLALQIRDRASGWRIWALALASVAAIAVRWAAVLNCVLIAAILLEGLAVSAQRGDEDESNDDAAIARWTWRRWRDRRGVVVALAIAMAVTLVGFITLRIALRVTPQEAALANNFNDPTEDLVVVKPDNYVSGSYAIVQKPEHGILGYARRFGSFGDWLSDLFWQPARLGHTMPVIEAPSLVVGWILLLVLAAAALHDGRRGQWVWVGLIVYMLALAMNWQHANARYLVPVIYLILAGLLRGSAVIARQFPRPGLIRLGSVVFIASMVLCNGVLWAIEVRVEQSNDFYETYEAGLNADLIAAARYLDGIGVRDIDIGVSERYVNFGHPRISRFGLRAMAMLTNRAIVSVPSRRCDPTPPDGSPPELLLNWAHSTRGAPIKWYLYQPEISPWRVWHFRLGWLQKLHEGKEPEDTGAGWRLYRMPPYEPTTQPGASTQPGMLATTRPTTMPGGHSHRLVLIDLHKVRPDPYRDIWPTHVPGL